jgi:nucleoside-diphosphate-sugar epimerase
MRVLVTGHRGYIGSILVPILGSAGHEVVGLDTDYFRGCSFGAYTPSIEELLIDVRDVQPEQLDGFDAVIHLAALSNDPMGELNPAWTDDINHRASIRLARLARQAGVRRFLFSSSCSIYGSNGDQPADEQTPINPLSSYAQSKVDTEADLLPLADDRFSPVSLRNATVYGVSPGLRVDLVVNNLVGWAYLTGQVRILSDGSPWRPLIHVQDIARAFLAILEAPQPEIHAQAFNIGAASENYQVRQVAEMVQEVVPGSVVTYSENRNPDPRDYRVDFGKLARTLPNYRPEWNVRRGIEELYAAYQRGGLTEDDFLGAKFTRMKTLSHLLSEGKLDATLRWKTGR